jgi:hypothetical protein
MNPKSAPRPVSSSQLLTGEERRRSQRVILKIPVTLQVPVGAKTITVHAATVSVNDHGAMVLCSRSFTADTKLELRNDRTGDKMTCRVTRAAIENSDGFLIPVEFASPDPAFWRISFPPRDWKPAED